MHMKVLAWTDTCTDTNTQTLNSHCGE